MKKEDLLKKVGELERRVTDLKIDDENKREEFSKIFNNVKSEYTFGLHTVTAREMTWNAIFCEIGKLLERGRVTQLEKELENSVQHANMLEQELQKKISNPQ